MKTITTEAWVLHSGQGRTEPTQLVLEEFTFPEISAEEVLAEPLYGCWEGNMTHSLNRNPIDICMARNEEKVVIGNAGVVRITQCGKAVTNVKEGDHCLVFCNGIWDEHGYPIKILGYDAPQTMGVLAKTMKLHERQVIRLPDHSPFSLPQWAAFSLRYITGYANWEVAYNCWRAQMKNVEPEATFVCAWGGGVSLAQVTLAQRLGCPAGMVASTPERLALLASLGIEPIDRRPTEGATFEERFLALIREKTNGRGVAIFIDNIGAPVYKLTLKALARQGVITTSGWKHGATIPISRAMECINRHLYVHTHYAAYEEGLAAMAFAESQQWMAPILPTDHIYTWAEVPQLVEDYGAGRIASYFPVFSIHPS